LQTENGRSGEEHSDVSSEEVVREKDEDDDVYGDQREEAARENRHGRP